MPELESTTVCLRFFGEALDPEELTALLGGSPTHSCRSGDLRISSNGREIREKSGSWRRDMGHREPGSLDKQIEELFFGLTDDLTVWRQLSERFQGDVFCGLFMQETNDGDSLSAQTLLALGARGLELHLDIYAPIVDPHESHEIAPEE